MLLGAIFRYTIFKDQANDYHNTAGNISAARRGDARGAIEKWSIACSFNTIGN
jgi:hypothetical protein